MVSRRGGFIEDIELFDASFFNISPREAMYLDPQQRLLLMESWHALEHAGIAPDRLKGSSTGVFVGIATQDYLDVVKHAVGDVGLNAYIATGNALSTASGRLSYALGLEGPNMALDTACSSSLVALHEACRSLQHGECHLALVGGVNAILTPDLSIVLSKSGMLSADDLCKTFDETADGYVRGEGCGVLVVKCLSDAKRDGDRVLTVIRGSGINQDGASSGLTVPNGDAQERLLREVLQSSGLGVDDVDYLECHGTATSLGDPVEVHAIGRVYGSRSAEHPLKLGSVKTNIGHLEAAAGMAGLMKTILAMEHHELPAHLNFKQLNNHINLNFPATIVTSNQPWNSLSKSRFAGVSSFGFSGTNAHVILEEAPVVTETESEAGDWVLCLSAKTQTALHQIIQDYVQHLESHPEERIQNVVYTANTGRAKLEFKAYFKAVTLELLLDNLRNNLTTDEPECTPTQGNKITLPTYPFDRTRYWLDQARNHLDHSLEEHLILGRSLVPEAGFVPLLKDAIQRSLDEKRDLLDRVNRVCLELGEINVQQMDEKQFIALLMAKNNTVFAAGDWQLIEPVLDFKQTEPVLFYDLSQIKQLQALLKKQTPRRIVLVTKNHQHGELLGFVKSLILEYPNAGIQLIDSARDEDLNFALNIANEPLLSCKNGQVFAWRLMPFTLPLENNTALFKPCAHILITGGMGALGTLLCKWLREQGVMHCSIISRQKPQHPEPNIDYYQADISDSKKVAHIVAEANQKYPLTGVFHLAGILDDGLFAQQTASRFKKVFDAKALGALNLHEATKDIPLDYFVMFSSIASSIGSPGQTNYAAANSFLDHLAEQRQQQGLPALSIQWGPWLEAGMAAHLGTKHQQNGITPQTILDALGHLSFALRTSRPVIQIATINWDMLAKKGTRTVWTQLMRHEINATSQERLITILQKLNKTEGQLVLQLEIIRIIEEILCIKELSLDKSFFDVGMDSLMAMDVYHRIQEGLSSDYLISNSLLYEYRTINALTSYISDLIWPS
jgi:acyl transferase domain-containing protein/acyl carrier protein